MYIILSIISTCRKWKWSIIGKDEEPMNIDDMELVMHTRGGQGGTMVVVEGKKGDVDGGHVQDDTCVAMASPESST